MTAKQEESVKTTVKYILFTIENRTIRVAVGIQKNHAPIAYWMKRGDPYSYVYYQGCMTEDEGNQILQAAEANNYALAIRLFHKYFRGEQSEYVYAKEEGWVSSNGDRVYPPISEVVPDDWFYECKEIMSLMTTNMREVLTFERDEEVW